MSGQPKVSDLAAEVRVEEDIFLVYEGIKMIDERRYQKYAPLSSRRAQFLPSEYTERPWPPRASNDI